MNRRILEIGPAIRPMHHRSQEGLELKNGEEYLGIDQPFYVPEALEHEVWEKAKEQYGDRARLVQGDAADLKDVADESIDELVALGIPLIDKATAEINRVLKPGGLIRLGTTTPALTELASTLGARLQQLGYKELIEEQERV